MSTPIMSRYQEQPSSTPGSQHNHRRNSPANVSLIFDLEICVDYTTRSVAVPVTIARHSLRHRRDDILYPPSKSSLGLYVFY